MPLPKVGPTVGKSPVGHLNGLVGDGLRSYSYRNNAVQLLGYKESPPATIKRGTVPGASDAAFHYLDRYLDSRADPVTDTEVEPSPRTKVNTSAIHSDTNPFTPDPVNRPVVRSQPAATINKPEPFGSTAGTKTGTTVIKKENRAPVSTKQGKSGPFHPAVEPALSPSTNTEIGNTLTKTGGNKAAPTQPEKEVNTESTEQKQRPVGPATAPLAKEALPHNSVIENKLLTGDPTVSGNSSPSPEEIQQQQNDLSLSPLVPKKYQQLQKRYRNMLENSERPSRFRADPNTRAAIARMQDRLAGATNSDRRDTAANSEKLGEAHSGAKVPLHGPSDGGLRYLQPAGNRIVKINKAVTNTFQDLPSPNTFRNGELTRQTEKIAALESELSKQRDFISKLNAENRNYQARLANFESQQKNNGDRSRRDSGDSTFWAKNRLTHAMLRIQS